ncbi:MAG: sensor histidine kinase [Bacteroides clarus]|uniref:sensor histidine kinase n=1 Tax=Bacteroides clarus TaxID=626929 RepID=UPI00241C976C|nr:HAMP domain-containing sensor histidine kinase [Bacteroides clarus]MBD9144621.1 sensor histidine kinase [Bacteroides clarus]
MKRIITILLAAFFCLCTQAYAQSRADELMKQAQESLAKKEYIKARYLFLQAYNSFASQEEYTQAVECGVNASALYHRENYYKEAFELLRGAEQLVGTGEQKLKKKLPDLRFRINKERLQMYINTKNPARAKEQLNKLEETAKAAGNDSLSNDFLYTQADYYYTFGMNSQGDTAFKKLIEQYKQQKNYAKVDECYKTLISIARKANNAGLVARTYDKYIIWTDSVKALTAQDELNIVKKKYDESLATIQEKDDSLSAKQYIIIGLCILAAVLAAALAIGAVILLRFIMLTRKQKKAISIANEHNELKTEFIQNISSQMEPTLGTLDPKLPGVQALRAFSGHIQELSELENSLSEPYEVQEKNISTFCESVMDKVRGKVQEDVTLTVNAPKLNVKINPEHLERILLHLLENAAEYTPAGGKIWLDFKKRGAHTHQFIISDTGCGIPEEQREDIFKPFTEVKDLTKGDGLGLPICSLIAAKMNGSLTLDGSYTKGARFVLELHA